MRFETRRVSARKASSTSVSFSPWSRCARERQGALCILVERGGEDTFGDDEGVAFGEGVDVEERKAGKHKA